MNKRGVSEQIITVFLLLGMLLLLMLFIFVWGLVAPQVVGLFNLASGEISSATQGQGNISEAVEIFSEFNRGLQNLEWISYGILVMSMIGFLVIAFFVRSYPFLIVIWIGFIVIIVFSSIFLSSAYQGLASDTGIVGQAYADWEGNNFILNYLPHIMSIMGVVGGFVLFILVSKDEEAEAVL